MVLLRNASDAYVNESRPNKNFSGSRRLYVKASGGDQKFAYIFFARPFPLGSTIQSATLRVYNGTTFEGAATLTVNRIKDKWSRNRITWNKKPNTYTVTKSLTKTDAPPGTEWAIDVKTILQSVSDGGVWFGFRITTNNGPGEWFHSSQSAEQYRPTLEITWSEAPDPPDDLRPDGGRVVATAKPTLRYSFTDVNGDTDLAACKVEIASTKAILLADGAEWKSPETPTTEPELDLAATTYTGLANGSTAWWRVKVKDGAGLWSAWSDPASFKYTPYGALVLSNPPNIASPFVDESTPPIIWTFTGQTQQQYQIIISKPNSMGDWIWTSGKITDTVKSVNLPDHVIKRDDTKYNVRVRVWDNLDREKTPDFPTYTEVSRDFLLDFDATTNPVTALKVSADSPWPWMKIEWDRTTAADRYEIWRDGGDGFEKIDIVDAADVLVSGTHYLYKDRTARGRTTQTWKVVAVVNNKGSKNNPTASGKPQANSRWLMDIDGTDAICILNPKVDVKKSESSALHRPLGRKAPVMIMQSLGYYGGVISGVLTGEAVPGLTAQAMLKRYKRLREQSGSPVVFFNVDQTMRGFIRNATYDVIARSGGTVDYAVEFEFYETGEA